MYRLWLVIGSVLALGACGTVKVSGIAHGRATQVAAVATPVPTPAPAPAAPVKPAEAPLAALVKGYNSPKDYVRDAVQSLQVGDVDAAREDVRAALKLDPSYANAKSLLQQIDGDAVAMLGPKNFEYEIKAGDSLSSVAKRYLGDPLRFHILAKYNGVDNPSRLNVGQKIKVPGEQRGVEVARVEPKPRSTPQAQLNGAQVITKAKRLADEGKYSKAAELLEGELENGELDDEEPVQDALVTIYIKQSDVLKRDNKITAAQKVLQKAAILQPTNAKVAAKIDAMKVQVADVDKLYKDAYSAYRRQKLDDAIKGFDKVLEIDPHHELAKLYRARAAQLTERLTTDFAGN
ncbi:MAG: LysM peptidoglycan-binding domain-containing protein [Pseudomonadota bacterium]